MSIASHLNSVLGHLLRNAQYHPTVQQAISVLDLTLLDQAATTLQLDNLFDQALTQQVAAVCVYPEHLPLGWISNTVKTATVVNFPDGILNLPQSLQQCSHALDKQADEIDFVFPYKLWLDNKKQEALDYCRQIVHFCHDKKITCKVIIESGAFESVDKLYQACSEVIATGCDFIKTSTGKIDKGASLASAFAMLCAIKDSDRNCGIKISGGVKTAEQAFEYMTLAAEVLGQRPERAWFRLGASSLLQELVGMI